MVSMRLTKQNLRSKMLIKLKNQKEADRERKSGLIKKKLFSNSLFKKAKKVMFYMSFDGEVNTKKMIKEAKRLGKTIAVPTHKGKNIIMPCLLEGRISLHKGFYGVSEPAVKRAINLEDLDIVIVPGLAFDKKGRRLGRGKGCYDHFLEQLPKDTPSLGLAFDFQILPDIPTNKRDQSVTEVLFA